MSEVGLRVAAQMPVFLAGGGDMGARIRAHDWAATPLGLPQAWPRELRTAVSIMLGSSFPTAIYWGAELRLLYNDAWAPIPGERHPWALGRPGADVWADIWDVIGPQLERVLIAGEGVSAFDQMLPMEREGAPRETYWNYSFTPIRAEDGTVLGVLNQGHETTAAVLGRRQARDEVERLERMFRQAPGAVAVLRGPTHVFEIVNGAYEALVGRTGLRGLTVAEALPEVASQGFTELLDQVYRSGEPYIGQSVSIALERVPGMGIEERLVDFVYQPLTDAVGRTTGIFVQATDVTDRARAEAELRAGERRLRIVLDSVSDGFYALDADWRFTLFNAACERFFGRAREQVVGQVLWDVFPEAVGSEFERRYREVMAGGEPITFEAASVAQPDRTVEMRAAPMPGGGVAVSFSDITERKRAEAFARSQTEQFRTLANAMPQLAWIAEADGYIGWYNRRWYDYTGTTPAEMEGWGWQAVHDPAVLPEVMERWPASIAAGEPFEMTFPLRGADGSFRTFLTRAEPLKDAQGKVLRWFGTNTDVQAAKEAEAALAEALEVKEVLLHEVNHRVKNSLQLVTSLLMLQAAQAREPQLRQALLEARGRISVVAAMHQRLYSTSQHDRVDFGDYIRDMAAETLRPLDASGRIALRVDVDEGIVVMLTKAVPLALVVSELVTNAVKYAFPAGAAGRLTVALTRTGSGIAIAVADDGVGLPDGFVPGRSGGLGMKIVTALTRQVRGNLSVERLEPGTQFRIDVPLDSIGSET